MTWWQQAKRLVEMPKDPTPNNFSNVVMRWVSNLA
jgi:hypothetical protein